MTFYVVVNRHRINANRKNGKKDPPIRVSRGRYGKPVYVNELIIRGDSRLIYDTENPMPCGATVWLETNLRPFTEKD